MNREIARKTLTNLMLKVVYAHNHEENLEISYENENEFLDDIGVALGFAISDMNTLQDIIIDLSGVCED